MSADLTPEEFVLVLQTDIDRFSAGVGKTITHLTMPYEFWMTGFVINLFREAGMLGFLQHTIKEVLENKCKSPSKLS